MENAIIAKFPVHPIIIGKIEKAYGVYGWVKVISFTDKISSIFDYSPWFVQFKSQWKILQLESSKLMRTYYIVKFNDFTNREFAMLFAKLYLVIDNTQLPLLCHGEYYWKDITGCQVITITGVNLGYVISIIETSAYDILVIKKNDNNFIKKNNYLIPFIQEKIIKKIDLFIKMITVDWNIEF